MNSHIPKPSTSHQSNTSKQLHSDGRPLSAGQAVSASNLASINAEDDEDNSDEDLMMEAIKMGMGRVS